MVHHIYNALTWKSFSQYGFFSCSKKRPVLSECQTIAATHSAPVSLVPHLKHLKQSSCHCWFTASTARDLIGRLQPAHAEGKTCQCQAT